jgi:hypothetical protein
MFMTTGRPRGDGGHNGCIVERHGRQPMRVDHGGRIRAPAGPHSRANLPLIAGSIVHCHFGDEAYRLDHSVQTYFLRSVSGKQSIREPPSHAGSAGSMIGKSSKHRGATALVWRI